MSILYVWMPFNYLWFWVVDAPFFFQERHCNEVHFILDTTILSAGSYFIILLTALRFQSWLQRLLLMTAYITAIVGLVIKAICMRGAFDLKEDFDLYYFHALVFIFNSVGCLATILKFLED